MSTDDAAGSNLPGYAATEELPPSYDYTPPRQYVVGGRPVALAFVAIHQLKAHLTLLRAFKRLRAAVEADEGARLPDHIRNLQASEGTLQALRWSCFVSLAVERCGVPLQIPPDRVVIIPLADFTCGYEVA